MRSRVETRQVEHILAALADADTPARLQALTEALRDALRIGHIAYQPVEAGGDLFGCGTYSTAWQERYAACNYRRIDPVVIGCFQRFHPVDWKQLDWSTRAARAFFLEARSYGLGYQGFSVPLRGPNGQFALFSVNDACSDADWAAFTGGLRPHLILMAHYLHEKALEFEPAQRAPVAPSLSPREVDAMTLLATGLSRGQAARQLQISEHTLRDYIESARFKLGALNTTHAVARALSRGLIIV